jgi:hypothetical protein
MALLGSFIKVKSFTSLLLTQHWKCLSRSCHKLCRLSMLRGPPSVVSEVVLALLFSTSFEW